MHSDEYDKGENDCSASHSPSHPPLCIDLVERSNAACFDIFSETESRGLVEQGVQTHCTSENTVLFDDPLSAVGVCFAAASSRVKHSLSLLDAALDEVHCQELFELPEPTTTLDPLTFDPDLVHVSLIKVAAAFLEFRSAFATASCVVALYSGPVVDMDLFAVTFAKNSAIAEFAIDTDCYEAYDEDIFPTTLLTAWIANDPPT